MATSTSPGQPNDDGVRYEQADFLTVNVYIDGPGDTTVRPSRPEVLQRIERDRALIDQMNEMIRREQERLNGRGPDDDIELKIM